jgi:hypothetical protein
MKRTVHRTLTTAAATALLALAGAALAAPAHADADVNALAGALVAHANSVVAASVFGTDLVRLPDPVAGVL